MPSMPTLYMLAISFKWKLLAMYLLFYVLLVQICWLCGLSILCGTCLYFYCRLRTSWSCSQQKSRACPLWVSCLLPSSESLTILVHWATIKRPRSNRCTKKQDVDWHIKVVQIDDAVLMQAVLHQPFHNGKYQHMWACWQARSQKYFLWLCPCLLVLAFLNIHWILYQIWSMPKVTI